MKEVSWHYSCELKDYFYGCIDKVNMDHKKGISEELVLSKIFLIRGEKVMIDRDLAALYGVDTKYLKKQVRRNIERFPEDFMFELTKEEFADWRRQIVPSNVSDRMGLRHSPFVFTEQGVAQLSSVLNSTRAIEVNIQIVRLFTKMKKLLVSHQELLIEMEKIRKKVSEQDHNIMVIFDYLKQFIKEREDPRRSIGFKQKVEEGR